MCKWYRIGNTAEFYIDHPIYRRVQYRPLGLSTLIRRVSIDRRKTDNRIEFLFEGTGFGNERLRLELEKFYPGTNYSEASSLGWFTVNPDTNDDLEKMFNFLRTLNSIEGHDLMTETLLTELKNIYQYLKNNSTYQPGFVHVIPDITSIEVYNNSSTDTSYKLLDLFEHGDRFSSKQFKKLLSKGEDPNQQDRSGEPIMLRSILFNLTDILELFLVYGGNPFLRGGDSYYSAYEFALYFNRTECINTITNATTRIQKPIENIRINACLFPNVNETTLKLSNGIEISTKYKLASSITKGEWSSLFKLYKDYFEVQNDTKGKRLEEIFCNDLTGNNKFIDIIYAKGEIIGLNLFQLIEPKDNSNKITLYWLYSLMHSDYRYGSLTRLLAFRPAYSLQLLLPEYTISVFALVVSGEGHGLMASNGDYFPKYIPTGSKKYVKELLAELAPGSKYNHHDITNYVVDEVRAKNPGKMSGHLDRTFFYKHLLEQAAEKTEEVRAATSFFVIGGDNLLMLNKLSLQLNIQLGSHIIELAKGMLFLMNQMNTTRIKKYLFTEFNPFSDSKLLFWRNIRRPDENVPLQIAFNEKNSKELKKLSTSKY